MAPIIQPARLLSRKAHIVPGQFRITELFFEVPKFHANPAAGVLKLFGRAVTKHERPIVAPPPHEHEQQQAHKPYFVYLEGGPGFGNRDPQDMTLTRFLLNRGYQVLYLDYRGTGLSTPVNAAALAREGHAKAQADYLKLFRQDSIVRDLEAVRLCLLGPDLPPERRQWSLFGQSFGGFVALTYLSKYPHALREVFMTGGLAPVGRTAEEVYRATYIKVAERNKAYYRKYPEDAAGVRRVVAHITREGGVALPGGGRLTARRLLTMGMAFGAHGGLDVVHGLVLRMLADLDQFGLLTRATLTTVEQTVPFDANPVYAILHEAIYCCAARGPPSGWAAYHVGKQLPDFAWLAGLPLPSPSPTPGAAGNGGVAVDEASTQQPPLFFSGEMIFPLHFETYPELIPMKEAADLLAECDDWGDDLYDEAQLRRNTVPVYAASFIDDMYVDFELARQTAKMVQGIQVYETNGLYHNALRARSDEVLHQLFKMRDDPID